MMKIGNKGALVKSLQLWLNKYSPCAVDGDFGPKTANCVSVAQRALGVADDGIVGPITDSAFIADGWRKAAEHPSQPSSPYPSVPQYRALRSAEKVAKFGSPGKPRVDAQPGGPITVDPRFARNIVRIDLGDWFPQARMRDFGARYLSMHRLVEMQWRAFFDDIVAEGHGDKIISCAGSWAPRYVRGSKTTFSSHAYATAVDFNAPQNWLGAMPAKAGERGSLVDVIEIGKRYKIYSGIWFSRLDGMHFESTRGDAELGLSA